jgi:hypothetical protein
MDASQAPGSDGLTSYEAWRPSRSRSLPAIPTKLGVVGDCR